MLDIRHLNLDSHDILQYPNSLNSLRSVSAAPKCDGSPFQFYGTPSFVVGAMSRVPSLTDFVIPDALCMVLGIFYLPTV